MRYKHTVAMPCRAMHCRILALAVFLWPLTGDAQTANEESIVRPAVASEAAPSIIDTSHCKAVAAGEPNGDLVSAVCEFALTYYRALPDFVCEQTISMIVNPQLTRVLREEVTFRKGLETYSNVTIDGKAPTPAAMRTIGFISAGEFGSDLVDLFMPPVVAEFKFRRYEKLHKVRSSVFEFHIVAERNEFWAIRDNPGVTIHPELKGELWVEPRQRRIVRLEIWPLHLPRDFGVVGAKVTIDYSEIRIRELGTFLLPSFSKTTVCQRNAGPRVRCSKNVLVFHNCQKFAVKSRILTDRQHP